MKDERERDFRLRSRRRRHSGGDEPRAWSRNFNRMIRYMRSSGWRTGSSGAARPFMQRCAVRVTYTGNRSRGQWAAHGRYLERESATHRADGKPAAFSSSGPVSSIHQALGTWQRAADPRVFKIIISPEFGDRTDLETLTRNLLGKMEQDLSTPLEWVATAHYNTAHPHVHVALRGLTAEKTPLLLNRDYVQHGIRRHAENLVTQQLGYRTALDASEAERRQIGQLGFTALDRALIRVADDKQEGADFLDVDLRKPKGSFLHLKPRLAFLEKLGLAKMLGNNRWRVQADFGELLRATSQASDRQRALAAHHGLLSDPRLPIEVTDAKTLEHPLEGRVISHGENENTGKPYMILEGTDGKIHFIDHTPEIEHARRRRQLQPDSFVRLRHPGGNARLVIVDYGDAHKILTNRSLFQSKAKILIQSRSLFAQKGWAGWLGKYEAALMREFQSEVAHSQQLHGR